MTSPATDKLWELRWNEIAALDRHATLIIQPTGAIEQQASSPGRHGHFRLLRDRIPGAATVNEIGSGRVLVAPPLWWGTSPHHLAYPGTISLSMKTMSDLWSTSLVLGRPRLLSVPVPERPWRQCRRAFRHGAAHQRGVGVSPAVVSYWMLIKDTCGRSASRPMAGWGMPARWRRRCSSISARIMCR